MAERLELDLTGLAYGGEAIGRDSAGRMLFVPFALPGERVSVEVVKAHKRWARAKLIQVLDPAPERVAAPRCKHFTHCGGCHYQHMPYASQLEAKSAIVREQLERIGAFRNPPVEPTVPSPDPWNYRNQLRFSLTAEGKLGFVTASSDAVFALEECHLPEPSLTELWPQIQLEPVDGLEQIAVRSGLDSDWMIVLHADRPPEVEVELDLPASVVWLDPDGAAVLAGEGQLWIEVAGRAFLVSAGSFFQANTAMAGALVERVMAALKLDAGATVYDLYAGVGLFSAFLAQAGYKVHAVEDSRWACADFEANLAEFDGISLYEASVEVALPAIPESPDAVVADPPRAGLGRNVVDSLIERSPGQLIYVSCDPATMARDARRLEDGGFRLERVTPLDLFPQTFHIETLSIWRR